VTVPAWSDIPGLITDEVADALAELSSAVTPGLAIVEVGSYHGKSTAYLAGNAPDGVLVYAVDPWELVDVRQWCIWCPQPELAEFQRNLDRAGLLWRVKARQGRSIDVARSYDGPLIGLLYIDGDHSAESVRSDIDAWRRYLAPDARIAVDDYGGTANPEVAPVVDGLVATGQLVWCSLEAERLAVLREAAR
jgi:hypothetical protein